MGAIRLIRHAQTRGYGRRPLSPGHAVLLKRAARGDPGFFDFLGKIGSVAQAVLPFTGPVGAVVSAGLSAVRGTQRSGAVAPTANQPGVSLVGPVTPRLPALRGSGAGAIGGPGLGGSLSVGGPMGINLSGGATAGGGAAGALSLDSTDDSTDDTGTQVVTATPTCTIKGYHFNKRGYFTKAGYVKPHTKCVRNRRRNPLNPRALHHSVSRLLGFQAAASRVEKSLGKLARRSHAGRSAARAAAPRRGHKAGCGCVVCRR